MKKQMTIFLALVTLVCTLPNVGFAQKRNIRKPAKTSVPSTTRLTIKKPILVPWDGTPIAIASTEKTATPINTDRPKISTTLYVLVNDQAFHLSLAEGQKAETATGYVHFINPRWVDIFDKNKPIQQAYIKGTPIPLAVCPGVQAPLISLVKTQTGKANELKVLQEKAEADNPCDYSNFSKLYGSSFHPEALSKLTSLGYGQSPDGTLTLTIAGEKWEPAVHTIKVKGKLVSSPVYSDEVKRNNQARKVSFKIPAGSIVYPDDYGVMVATPLSTGGYHFTLLTKRGPMESESQTNFQ